MTNNIFVPSSLGIDFLGISYCLGAQFEGKGKYGTHHLMEHLMCKTFNHLRPKMKKLGVKYNAMTGDHKIIFTFEGLTESLGIIANEVYSCITSGSYEWSEDEFNNEKLTVFQEYEDCFNEQISGTLENKMRACYGYYGPIGLYNDIENFTYKESLEGRGLFSRPDFICQVGSKNIEVETGTRAEFIFSPPIFGEYNLVEEEVPKAGKKLGTILSHEGVKNTVLQYSPYEGLDDFTYEEAIFLLESHFSFDKFLPIIY